MISPVPTRERAVVESYMATMQAGADGLNDLLDLFSDDAVYVEPFSGQPTVHSGKAEIRAFYEYAFSHEMQSPKLTLDRLDLDGERLRAEWTCVLPGLPRPMRGFDLLTLRDGRITRLETTVTEH